MGNKHIGSSLESLFDELGELEEVKRLSLKKGISVTILERLAQLQLSKAQLAAKLRTSRSQLDRLLDPDDTSVTLRTLVRVATVLDLEVACGLHVPNVAPVVSIFLSHRRATPEFGQKHTYVSDVEPIAASPPCPGEMSAA
jgi:predicted XRE-type DNA-binding protein